MASCRAAAKRTPVWAPPHAAVRRGLADAGPADRDAAALAGGTLLRGAYDRARDHHDRGGADAGGFAPARHPAVEPAGRSKGGAGAVRSARRRAAELGLHHLRDGRDGGAGAGAVAVASAAGFRGGAGLARGSCGAACVLPCFGGVVLVVDGTAGRVWGGGGLPVSDPALDRAARGADEPFDGNLVRSLCRKPEWPDGAGGPAACRADHADSGGNGPYRGRDAADRGAFAGIGSSPSCGMGRLGWLSLRLGCLPQLELRPMPMRGACAFAQTPTICPTATSGGKA